MIGRPVNMSLKEDYGRLDMSHFLIFFRETNEYEMKQLQTIILKSETPDEKACCKEKAGNTLYYVSDVFVCKVCFLSTMWVYYNRLKPFCDFN